MSALPLLRHPYSIAACQRPRGYVSSHPGDPRLTLVIRGYVNQRGVYTPTAEGGGRKKCWWRCVVGGCIFVG